MPHFIGWLPGNFEITKFWLNCQPTGLQYLSLIALALGIWDTLAFKFFCNLGVIWENCRNKNQSILGILSYFWFVKRRYL